MEAVGTASETRDQFLQLLVTQLRHQDPLEPTKQEDFLAQLAQFSTLEGIEKLNANVEGFLSTQLENQATQNSFLVELQQFQNMASAANLVGKEVEFESDSGNTEIGRVDGVVIKENTISLRVGDDLIPISRIQEISSTDLLETEMPPSRIARRDSRFD